MLQSMLKPVGGGRGGIIRLPTCVLCPTVCMAGYRRWVGVHSPERELGFPKIETPTFTLWEEDWSGTECCSCSGGLGFVWILREILYLCH